MITGDRFCEASYFGGRYYSFQYSYTDGYPDQIILTRKDDGERVKKIIGVWRIKQKQNAWDHINKILRDIVMIISIKGTRP